MSDELRRTVLAACQRFRLHRDVPHAAGRLGAIAGTGTGASVEFRDYRRYVPGDDPRHIDWAAYGRTRQLMVRLFREEISPFVDIVLDGSRSMALADGRKSQLARELAGFCLESSRLDGGGARLFLAGDDCRPLSQPADIRFEAGGSVLFGDPARCVAHLKPRGLRVVISDFLTIQQPDAALRRLAANAARVLAIRVLGPWEADPPPGGLDTLVDAETGASLPVPLAQAALRHYRERLDNILAGLRDACARSGGALVDIRADIDLLGSLRRDFLPLGLVRVA